MTSMKSQHLLKANDIRGLGSKVVFNFEDLRQRCDDYVEKVRRQTQQMIKDAQLEADGIRQNSFQDAKDSGRREGLQNADVEIEKRVQALAEKRAAENLQTMIPAMQKASDELVREHDRWLAQWEASAIRLSVAIAEKVLRRHLEIDPSIATELITQALELAAGSPHVRLRINPVDLELLGDQAEKVVQSAAAGGQTEIISDESISCGGCVIETEHGVIDATLETQLERITSELIEHS